MALKKPVPVGDVKPVRQEALALAADLARVKVAAGLTKFRFMLGSIMIVMSVLIFLAGESVDLGKHFRPDFPDRTWLAARVLFVTGLAFSGREVLDAVMGIFRRRSDGTH